MIEGWLIVADDILTLEPREWAAHFWKERNRTFGS
jgi:hypothetical protein